MRLTVLGNNGPYPSAGGACSGYLVEDGDIKLLLDCGSGVLGNLQKFTRFDELDAILLSHLHSDHMSDMMVLRYAVQIKMNRGELKAPLKVYAPSEPAEEYGRLSIPGIFNLKPLDESTGLEFGKLKLKFGRMKHPVTSYGMCIENGLKKFVYSGDTSWNDNLVGFAAKADMLLIDAGLLSRDKRSDNVPHLTAAECGTVARTAGVKRLMLTHFWPEDDTREHLSEASAEFPGVEISRLLGVYEI